jgi:adhesin transport system membrane fusion protein
MLLLLAIALAAFLGWAAWFQIDQTVRAQGQLIPLERTQVIQAADGGVLGSILVHEGQAVTAGQPLAVLERERPNAAYEESRAKDAALAAALVRAQAEAGGQAPQFGARFQEFGQFVAAQQALYAQRRRSLEQEIATLDEGQVLAQQELAMLEALLKTGDASRLEVMRAQRQVSEQQGRINAVRNKYLQDARQEASKLAEELASSRYKLDERRSVLAHTTLTAPVAGVVKLLKVSTIGGVLRAGDELMQISPTQGDMVIELKVNPVDIGQLQIGLPVAVKLDAFDYAVYNGLQGTLSYLSSDTLVEAGPTGTAQAFYRAQVRIQAQSQAANAQLAAVALKPGMTATVDIRVGQRSVLNYLAKPVAKAFGGAMNER